MQLKIGRLHQIVNNKFCYGVATQMQEPDPSADESGVAARLRSLRQARNLSQSELARLSGVNRTHVWKIEKGELRDPRPDTLAALAKALNCDVAELTGSAPMREVTIYETDRELRELVDGIAALPKQDGAEVLRHAMWSVRRLTPEPTLRSLPNSSKITILLAEDAEPRLASGRVSKRKAVVSSGDPARLRERMRAAATPRLLTFYDGNEELPIREVPTHYFQLGAEEVRKVEGDSMIDALIGPNDLVFVRPESNLKAADGEIVIARVNGDEYIKVLDLSGGQIALLSENPKYDAMVIDEDHDRFEIVGVVVGRSGYVVPTRGKKAGVAKRFSVKR